MKTLRVITLLIFSTFFAGGAFAQSSGIPGSVISALNSGDASKLAADLNNNVELVISGKNNVYSKQQAVGIIADFFKKNTVTGFNVTHKSDKGASSFLIGTLNTKNGDHRVYVLTRSSDGKSLIQQIRIEKE